MILTIPRLQLLDALRAAESSLPKASSSILLGTYHLTFSKSKLRIETYNGVSGYRAFLSIQNDNDFSFCLPSDVGSSDKRGRVVEVLSALSDMEINLSIDNHILTISGDRATLKFQVYDDQDYPNLDQYLIDCNKKPEGVVCDVVKRDYFKLCLEKLRPCIPNDRDKRDSVLGGFILRQEYLWATDGHRLGWLPTPIFKSATIEFVVPSIVGNRKLEEIIPEADDLEVAYDPVSKIFQMQSVDTLVFVSTLIGAIPPVEKLSLGKTYNYTFEFSKFTLQRTIETLLLLSTHVFFERQGDTFTVSTANSNDTGVFDTDAQITQEVDSYKKDFPANGFRFSGFYLASLLRGLDGSRLLLKTCGATSPFLLELATNPEDQPAVKYILMPLQVNPNR